MIKYLTIIHNYLTAVYYLPRNGWQYTIVLQDGNLFAGNNYYPSSQEAYQIAKKVIYLVIACDQEYSSLNNSK